MKQAIKIPETVTSTVFNLPCIFSVHKENDTICYLLFDYETGNYVKAYPTDWLCEDEDGRWSVVIDKEYKKQQL